MPLSFSLQIQEAGFLCRAAAETPTHPQSKLPDARRPPRSSALQRPQHPSPGHRGAVERFLPASRSRAPAPGSPPDSFWRPCPGDKSSSSSQSRSGELSRRSMASGPTAGSPRRRVRKRPAQGWPWARQARGRRPPRTKMAVARSSSSGKVCLASAAGWKLGATEWAGGAGSLPPCLHCRDKCG